MLSEPKSVDLVPLSSAAATVYLALGKHDTQLQVAEGVLDVVAIALAACIPIYGARDADKALRRLSDADVAGGRFLHGATRLHFPSGAAEQFTRLAVTAPDLALGMERLKRAGVNFSEARFEPAPRRIPRVAPD
jgi:hypothetical protein